MNQSPIEKVVEAAERNIEYVVSNPDMYDVSVQVKKILRQALTEVDRIAREEECERLMKSAQDYKEHGFELETFIYSGFIPDLPE